MKRRATYAFGALAVLGGCRNRVDRIPERAMASAAVPVTRPPALPNGARGDAPAQIYVDSMGKANAHLTGGQIVGAVTALDDAEIAAARLATARARTAVAREFAERMIAEHTHANEQIAEIVRADTVAPASSPHSAYADRLGGQTLARLRSVRAEDFDSAYVGTQIGAHREAMASLDRQLIPAADAPGLRAFLGSLRETVDEHLQHAIQAAATLAAPEAAR